MLKLFLHILQHWRWLLVLALVCSAQALSWSVPAMAEEGARPVPRIVNGVQTSRFPSTGALLIGGNPDTAFGVCSGVLLGCDTFLTAAHCVCDGEGADCQEGSPFAPDPSAFFVFLQHAGFFRISRIAVRPDFIFPVADVAVLKLARRVTGIAPTPLTNAGPPVRGTAGIIAGFGTTGGIANDYGIKRVGEVVLAACPKVDDLDLSTSVCWDFTAPVEPPGTDSNTCSGDSGGPLFIRNNDFGTFAVAGVTSGGTSDNCLPEDQSFDANVFLYRDWIITQSGADIHNVSCGNLPQVGEVGTKIFTALGELNAELRHARHVIQVPPHTALLRMTMSAADDGLNDFDLFVKAGDRPTPEDFDCRRHGTGQFAFCEFRNPPAGSWHILVQRFTGTGPYQIVGTTFDAAEVLVLCHGVEATIVGTEKDDTLVGTPGDDVIAGLGGKDVIAGLAGNDRICGGPGKDVMDGGTGNDRLFGDEGNDVLRGGEGNDRVAGGPGDDQVTGGSGDDTLQGDAGNDVLDCGAGTDVANGGEGTDTARSNCEAIVAVP